MPTLHLIYKAKSGTNGLWKPADHVSQEIALQHFSGGSIAINYDRLYEIIYTAGIHGWKVATEGDPKYPHEEKERLRSDVYADLPTPRHIKP